MYGFRLPNSIQSLDFLVKIQFQFVVQCQTLVKEKSSFISYIHFLFPLLKKKLVSLNFLPCGQRNCSTFMLKHLSASQKVLVQLRGKKLCTQKPPFHILLLKCCALQLLFVLVKYYLLYTIYIYNLYVCLNSVLRSMI